MTILTQSASGKNPDERDVFTISVSVGSRISMCCLRSQVGMGSNQQDFVPKDLSQKWDEILIICSPGAEFHLHLKGTIHVHEGCQ